MPKTKTRSGAKKRFKVTAAGKVLRRRRHRTTPPGHHVKRGPGSRRRAQRDAPLAPGDTNAVKKMLRLR